MREIKNSQKSFLNNTAEIADKHVELDAKLYISLDEKGNHLFIKDEDWLKSFEEKDTESYQFGGKGSPILSD